MFQAVTVLTVSNISPESSTDFESLKNLLARLNSTEVAVLAAKLNIMTSNVSKIPLMYLQHHALTLLVRDKALSIPTYNTVLECLKRDEEAGLSCLAIPRAGLLELIRSACCYSLAESGAEMNPNFYKALLTCSDINFEREINSVQPLFETTDDEARFVNRRTIAYSSGFADARLAIGRADLLLREHFFDVNPEYTEKFEQISSMTPSDWIICNSVVILCGLDAMNRTPEMTTFQNVFQMTIDKFLAKAPMLQSKIEKFFLHSGQTTDELRHSFLNNPITESLDFNVLRTRPVLLFEDNKAIVLDRRMFVENMVFGPLFCLMRNGLGEQVLQAYGKSFQNYIYALLRAADRAQGKNSCPYLINEPSAIPMPVNDIVIGDTGGACALIEVKGTWMNDKVLAQDKNKFAQEVEKKYNRVKTVGPDGKKLGAKGIPQLVEVIKALVGKQLKVAKEVEFVLQANEIFPVFVVNDVFMAEPLMANKLTSEFGDKLGVKFNGVATIPFCGDIKLHNLVILKYTDVELFEHGIWEGGVLGLLREYSLASTNRLMTFGNFFNHHRAPVRLRPEHEQLVFGRVQSVLNELSNKYFDGQINPNEVE